MNREKSSTTATKNPWISILKQLFPFLLRLNLCAGKKKILCGGKISDAAGVLPQKALLLTTKCLVILGGKSYSRIPCQKSEPQAYSNGCQDLGTFSCPVGVAQGQNPGKELSLPWATGESCAVRLRGDRGEGSSSWQPLLLCFIASFFLCAARLWCCL